MGRDLEYRIIYPKEKDLENMSEDDLLYHETDLWSLVPNVSRHNDVLGYICRTFTKSELEEYIKTMTQEIRDYDYNMADLADAIWGLTYIHKQMIRDDWKVLIRYE
jgi:hypothetical protein